MSGKDPYRLAQAATIAALLATVLSAQADIRMPSIFGSHMVLQRDEPIAVWGWANPGESVKVTLADKTAGTTAGPRGNWRLQLAPLAVSTGLTMTVQGTNTITFDDVAIGDVWLSSSAAMQTP